MKKSLSILLALASLSFAWSAEQYKYKDLKEFKSLDSFTSVEKFETYFNRYIQDCIDNSYGGSMGIPCYIGYELWDRELNKYYKKLHAKLKTKEKIALEESQRAWFKNRDSTIKFNSLMLDSQFTEEGTLYAQLRAGAADADIAPIIKERALYLKYWYENYGKNDLVIAMK